MDEGARLTVELERSGLATEFSTLFRSFSSLYNSIYEERRHRLPKGLYERLRVIELEMHSPGHVVFEGLPLVTQWLSILIGAANATVGAAGIWLAFRARNDTNHQFELIDDEYDRLRQDQVEVLYTVFVKEAALLEHEYGLLTSFEGPDLPGQAPMGNTPPQLTFEFLKGPFGELSPHDKKGILALQQIKSMQRRHLIAFKPSQDN